MEYEFNEYKAQGRNFIALLAVASIATEIIYGISLDLPFFEARMGDFHHRTNNEVWLSDYLGAAKKKQIRERTAVHRAAVHFIQEIFEGLRTGTLTKRDPPADICDRLPFLRPSQDPSIAKLTVGSIDALFQAVQSSMGTN